MFLWLMKMFNSAVSIVEVVAKSLTTAFPKFDNRNVWPQLGFTLFIACCRCLGRTQLWGQCLVMFWVKISQFGTAGLSLCKCQLRGQEEGI